MRGRILAIDTRTPTPDEDSGSATTLSFLQILARAGFEVTFAPLDLADAKPCPETLTRAGIKTLSHPQWPSIEQAIEACAPQSDLVVIFRLPTAERIFDLVRSAAPDAKIIFHTIDLHFLRRQRKGHLTGDMRGVWGARDRETDLMARSDASIVVSPHELNLVRQLRPDANVHYLPILQETPARSKTAQSNWRLRKLRGRMGPIGRWLNRRDPALSSRQNLVFLGGYKHLPNVDAVLWFVDEVWPMLLKRGFPHKFIIAGSHMPPEISDLASERVEVRGFVKDLAALFEQCRLSVAPLRYGAGVKGKVITSISYGVPVVATPMAVEGTGLQTEKSILVAETPAEMAKQIMRLYEDADLWQRLSANGYRAFERRYALAAGERAVLALVDEVLKKPRPANALSATMPAGQVFMQSPARSAAPPQ